MQKTIVLASGNRHKRDEILRVLAAPVGTLLCADEVAPRVPHTPIPDPVEDADSYVGNATIKAHAFALWAGVAALADDSGMEVAALDGRPGLYSARYAGASASFADNVERVLRELKGVPAAERRACFITVLVLSDGERVLYQTRGECPGVITEAARGSGGFGYDPIFQPDGSDHTFAEMEPAEKDRLSHRGVALAQLAADCAAGRCPLPFGSA